ncbi:MAG: L,D-transpeptidase/peptidoglycan binding protein [Lachnospiraceae bacterium]|nr:L,D-transpeptidase/peptidoglycan binding protein [Lachnospiraceae bacterium]
MRKRKKKKKVLNVAVSVLAAAAVVYLGIVLFFSRHFYFNTIINGENYSANSANTAQNHILDTSGHYVLQINGRDQLVDTITSADIALRMEFGDEFADIIKEQNAFLWPLSFFKKSEYTVDTMVTYNKEELDRKIDTLCFFQSENIRQPQNAYLSDYTEDGYKIVPEYKGTVPVREKIYSAVENAVDLLAEFVDLDEKGCYTDASITAEDKELQMECDKRNRLVGTTITYQFGDDVEVLDGSIIKDWLVIDGETIDIDPELAREYVNSLARKYDTWGKKREFQTTKGETITIAEGAYGWWMNRVDETQELIEQIKNGQSGERTPVYRAQAAQYGDDDIGDSYVEIDLTSQHLWVYKEGKLVEDTDFVSGNVSSGYNTPVGIYGITYKERNATLRGANYASKVSYWMPFNGNVGMHDASWRNSFGNNIYLTNGSHGCVNLPVKKAEVIYDYVEQGEPVIVYGGQTSVPRAERVEEADTQVDPEEAANPELTPEQQIQILIEAGLLNPDGTPIQPTPQEIPEEVPMEIPVETPAEILQVVPEEVPQEIG